MDLFTPPDRTPQIIYTCHVCQEPIERGTGAVACAYVDINAVTAQARADRERRSSAFNIGEVLDLVLHGPTARWLPRHDACLDRIDPNRRDAYELDVERIDTAAGLATWQNHLWRKRWFPLTRWDTFVSDQVIPALLQQGNHAAGR